MRNGTLLRLATLALGLAVVTPAAAQTGSADQSAIPRLADGRPDLGGVWDFRTITPLERPIEHADKAVLTEEEAAELTRSSIRVDRAPGPGEVGAYNQFWFDAGAGVIEGRRTSLLVDPPNGRLPETVPGVLRQIGSYGRDMPGERPIRYRGARGWGSECLGAPPVLPAGYNQNLQVFQSADHVVLLHEMVHDARIVSLDGRPALPESIRQWMGDSRGYWDGDTLVIESTNFSDKTLSFNDTITSGMGSGETLHLTERLRRVDANTLEYEFTVTDPATFTRSFTGMIPMKKNDEPLFEYACHEGNHGLRDILAGARVEEAAAAAAK